MLRLLEIFAQHLSLVANQLIIECQQSEPSSITRARQFILEHRGEELSLATVAKTANMSSYYFCKTFKRVTGLNFTDYLARVRIEKAKELLLNPNARVSEIVFDVWFSIDYALQSHFQAARGQVANRISCVASEGFSAAGWHCSSRVIDDFLITDSYSSG